MSFFSNMVMNFIPKCEPTFHFVPYIEKKNFNLEFTKEKPLPTCPSTPSTLQCLPVSPLYERTSSPWKRNDMCNVTRRNEIIAAISKGRNCYLAREGGWGGWGVLWFRTTKNRDLRTGLVRSVTCLQHSHSLTPRWSLRSHASLRLLTPKLAGKWMIRCLKIRLLWTKVGGYEEKERGRDGRKAG